MDKKKKKCKVAFKTVITDRNRVFHSCVQFCQNIVYNYARLGCKHTIAHADF